VYADFVHGRYDRTSDSVNATSLTLTAVRTLSPRWYLAARGSRQTTGDMLQPKKYGHHYYSYSGLYGGGGGEEWEDVGAANALTVQAVAGYRLSPDVTFRAGYAGYRAFGSDQLNHGFACSVVGRTAGGSHFPLRTHRFTWHLALPTSHFIIPPPATFARHQSDGSASGYSATGCRESCTRGTAPSRS